MAHLYTEIDDVSPYLKVRRKFHTEESWNKLVSKLKTVMFKKKTRNTLSPKLEDMFVKPKVYVVKQTTTVYVGNLSYYTDEEQCYALFSLCGPVRRVIMGINKFTHLPCGFCFVEYYFRKDAVTARNNLNGSKLDDRVIRVDLDPGFEQGRQYGRGTTGGQVRDDRRTDYDEGRGGLPPRVKQKMEIEQQMHEHMTTATDKDDTHEKGLTEPHETNEPHESNDHFGPPPNKRQKLIFYPLFIIIFFQEKSWNPLNNFLRLFFQMLSSRKKINSNNDNCYYLGKI
ncbi:hypothetical protein RFI_11069 [Reticulomyxa filosa]|uniref:Nuclear cap-binding protein subunit 2 n=1 Tax=Reticulomyxa filosa TaxID=46433 RepID=X6NJH0_RETFI|nr:hypothetical protein RFI_11069 [Reticulomyxa filosa]|eukprot:ETO26068.1 hypothetical protein RFI_11069 [Reticulomyxa filosa]